MKRLPRLLAVCCTTAVFVATAALAEFRTVTLSVSGMT